MIKLFFLKIKIHSSLFLVILFLLIFSSCSYNYSDLYNSLLTNTANNFEVIKKISLKISQSAVNNSQINNNNNIEKENIEIDNELSLYISKKLKEYNYQPIFEGNSYTEYLDAITYQFIQEPIFEIVDMKNKVIKKYEYSKDYIIKIDQYSTSGSISKRALTITDPSLFPGTKGDILIISKVFYDEKYDPILYQNKISAIITNVSDEQLISGSSLLLPISAVSSKNDGFIKVFVNDKTFSEIAQYTYLGFKIKIKSNFEFKPVSILQSAGIIPIKSDNLTIIVTPITNNNSNIAYTLAYAKYIQDNKKYLKQNVIFLFSAADDFNFFGSINFLSIFNSFPENSSCFILEDITTSLYSLFENEENGRFDQDKIILTTAMSKNNAKQLDRIISRFDKISKKENVETLINTKNFSQSHFAYIYSGINALTINIKMIDDCENTIRINPKKINLVSQFFDSYLLHSKYYKIIIIISVSIVTIILLLILFKYKGNNKDKGRNLS